MKHTLTRALVALAIAALLTVAPSHGAQAAPALSSLRAGSTQLCDPVDVPWGG